MKIFRNLAFAAVAASGFSGLWLLGQQQFRTAASAAASLTVSPGTVAAGGTVGAGWSDIAAPSPKDWIGLYTPGSSGTSYLAWVYVSCSQTAGAERGAGSCPFVIPSAILPGNYELRLLANDGLTELARSGPLTVTASGPTVSASPNTVAAGDTVTATWNGIAAPSPRDWIGLYQLGAGETSYLTWIYVSCSQAAGGARAAGSCPFAIPSALSPGTYRLRLLADDGYTSLASSEPLTVRILAPTPSVTPTPTPTPAPTPTPNPNPAPGRSLGSRVLVVYNSNSAESKSVADYYLDRRSIPAINEFGYAFTATDTIDYAAFYVPFEAALKAYLGRSSSDGVLLRDKILYVVFTYGTPFQVDSAPDTYRGYPSRSLDSYVADLWAEAPLSEFTNGGTRGTVRKNLYHACDPSRNRDDWPQETVPPTPFQSFADFRDRGDNRIAGYPNNGPGARIYSVWRVDAPSAAKAKAQIDGGILAEANGGPAGIFYFGITNYNISPWGGGADVTRYASEIAIASPRIGPSRVVVDHQFYNRAPDAAGYFGWGDKYQDVFAWNTGAFGNMGRSGSLQNGPRAGLAAALANNEGQMWSCGAIDASGRGITSTQGCISESTTRGVPASDVALRALLAGANMGDAWMRAHIFLRGNMEMVGDPLYMPFK